MDASSTIEVTVKAKTSAKAMKTDNVFMARAISKPAIHKEKS